MLRSFLQTANGLSAIFFFAFGVLTVAFGMQYELGTASQMGPGFFPVILGGLLALVGIGVGIQAISSETVEMPAIDWRALIVIPSAVILSALLIETAGLIVSVMVLVLIASAADREFKLSRAVAAAVVLAALAWTIFIFALDLRIPTWGF